VEGEIQSFVIVQKSYGSKDGRLCCSCFDKIKYLKDDALEVCKSYIDNKDL
jgi:hypothetical protein